MCLRLIFAVFSPFSIVVAGIVAVLEWSNVLLFGSVLAAAALDGRKNE
jgi:hypothetical protein